MSILVLAFSIGVIGGLRAITAPTVVSWAARLGWINLFGIHLAWLGYAATPWILSVLALGEIINDKLPKTPSGKIPPQFITRIISGAFSGAALGISQQSLIGGLLLGAIGAVVGALGGAYIRSRLAKAFGNDLSAALLEDVVGDLYIVHLAI